MRISIKSMLFDLNLFYNSVHQTIQSFVKEWIVPELYKKIPIKIRKTKESKQIEKIQTHFKIYENLDLIDKIKQFLVDAIVDNKSNTDNFKCFNCGFLISLHDIKDKTCDKCK